MWGAFNEFQRKNHEDRLYALAKEAERLGKYFGESKPNTLSWLEVTKQISYEGAVNLLKFAKEFTRMLDDGKPNSEKALEIHENWYKRNLEDDVDIHAQADRLIEIANMHVERASIYRWMSSNKSGNPSPADAAKSLERDVLLALCEVAKKREGASLNSVKRAPNHSVVLAEHKKIDTFISEIASIERNLESKQSKWMFGLDKVQDTWIPITRWTWMPGWAAGLNLIAKYGFGSLLPDKKEIKAAKKEFKNSGTDEKKCVLSKKMKRLDKIQRALERIRGKVSSIDSKIEWTSGAWESEKEALRGTAKAELQSNVINQLCNSAAIYAVGWAIGRLCGSDNSSGKSLDIVTELLHWNTNYGSNFDFTKTSAKIRQLKAKIGKRNQKKSRRNL